MSELIDEVKADPVKECNYLRGRVAEQDALLNAIRDIFPRSSPSKLLPDVVREGIAELEARLADLDAACDPSNAEISTLIAIERRNAAAARHRARKAKAEEGERK